jgi:predicted nucleic acid-binding protein
VGSGDILVTANAKDFKKIPGLRILPLPEHKN